MMILYIYGEDTFRSREYLHQMVSQFKKQRDPQGYNVVFLNGKEETAGKIFGELMASPFLSERRMIVIENILTSSDKDTLKQLIDKIKENKIPESNAVVFWQGEPTGKIKECKILSEMLVKEKYAQEFKKLEGPALLSWAKKQISEQGGSINPVAINYLGTNAKGDMWFLRSLIQQLTAYKKGQEISLADVKLFLEEKAEDNVFNMVDAVVNGNHRLAFKLLEDQRRNGEDDHFLFSMISRQFKILLEIKDAMEKGENPTNPATAKNFGLHPFVIKKSLPLVRRYSREQLIDIYNRFLQIDIKVKTGQGGQSELLDLFVGAN